jgi:hypothetical protein
VVFSYQRATEPSIPIPLYPFAIVFAIVVLNVKVSY